VPPAAVRAWARPSRLPPVTLRREQRGRTAGDERHAPTDALLHKKVELREPPQRKHRSLRRDSVAPSDDGRAHVGPANQLAGHPLCHAGDASLAHAFQRELSPLNERLHWAPQEITHTLKTPIGREGLRRCP
jgi:hypothetical protein